MLGPLKWQHQDGVAHLVADLPHVEFVATNPHAGLIAVVDAGLIAVVDAGLPVDDDHAVVVRDHPSGVVVRSCRK